MYYDWAKLYLGGEEAPYNSFFEVMDAVDSYTTLRPGDPFCYSSDGNFVLELNTTLDLAEWGKEMGFVHKVSQAFKLCAKHGFDLSELVHFLDPRAAEAVRNYTVNPDTTEEFSWRVEERMRNWLAAQENA